LPVKLEEVPSSVGGTAGFHVLHGAGRTRLELALGI